MVDDDAIPAIDPNPVFPVTRSQLPQHHSCGCWQAWLLRQRMPRLPLYVRVVSTRRATCCGCPPHRQLEEFGPSDTFLGIVMTNIVGALKLSQTRSAPNI